MSDEDELKAAKLRVREHVDKWIEEFGETGFHARIGKIPSLSIRDLRLVLEEAEGPHGWALVVVGDPGGDGMLPLTVLRTYIDKESAKLAVESFASSDRFRLAYWDENGRESCWRLAH